MLRKKLCLALALLVLPARAEQPDQPADQESATVPAQRVIGGELVIELDPVALEHLGMTIVPRTELALPLEDRWIAFPVDPSSSATTTPATPQAGFLPVAGAIHTRGALAVSFGDQRVSLGNLSLSMDPDAGWILRSTLTGDQEGDALRLSSVFVDAAGDRLRLMAELSVSRDWAVLYGLRLDHDAVIGLISVDAELAIDGTDMGADTDGAGALSGRNPDVIVGDLHQTNSYGSSNGIAAFAVGTISCNIGGTDLNWYANTNEHPVIGQNMFRLKDGRFEQIGQSWLKHGFFALSQTLCSGPGGCDGDPSGEHLGPGCSDPYDASLNGSQGNLGPRSQVNPYTGFYPFPYSAPSAPPIIGRRLQVHLTDLEPSLNAGALYFVEGQYVASDDSSAGNQNNNASYRRVNVLGGGSSFSLGLTGSTQRMKPAIRAWKDNDPSVVDTDLQVLGDGMFLLAAKATDLGNGVWHYEYALQNLNVNAGGRSFSIPLFFGAVPTNIGFHDVDSHSGEPYDLTDWAVTVAPGSITWSTDSPAVNPNANALRWGTLYNFRFDLNAPPDTTFATIGLFDLAETTMGAPTVGPDLTPPDCNNNGIGDPCDVDCGAPGGLCDVPGCGLSADCSSNFVPDECENDTDSDGVPDSCDLCPGFDDAVDADADGTPDGCDNCPGFDDDLDGDGDGVPDDCDNCQTAFNPSQADDDTDGLGNACDPDYCDPMPENDHFDTNPGWTTQNAGATAGFWQWGVPIGGGDREDPPADFDGGGACYLTGNTDGDSDVDGGVTHLLSPTYVIAPGEVTLSYAYWLGTTDLAGGDTLVIAASQDGGTNWTQVALYNTDGAVWRTDSIDIRALLPIAETLVLRFSATDGGSATVLEAGIDSVEITVECLFDCSDDGVCDDGNFCTTDVCNAGVCEFTYNNFVCTDGDVCTSNDACVSGACVGGPPPGCSGTDCTDCNQNGVRDDCEGLPDCDGNGLPDECEYTDCNGNQVADVCDIALGTSIDCDGGPIGNIAAGITRWQSLCINCHGADGSGGFGPDIRDHTRDQIWNMLLPPTTHPGGAHPSYTQQDFADLEAFLASSGSRGRLDRVPDECQTLDDCDNDSLTDACELEDGTQVDLDYDGYPDACIRAAPVVAENTAKNRYLSFTPGTTEVGGSTGGPLVQALRVQSPDYPGVEKWLSAPDLNGVSRLECTPTYRDWGAGMVHVGDQEVRPTTDYVVQGLRLSNPEDDEAAYSDPVMISTVAVWGDTVGQFTGSEWTAPNGVVNFHDVTACLQGFQALPQAPPFVWVDVEGEIPNEVVNFADVQRLILAFQGSGYPFTDPQMCP